MSVKAGVENERSLTHSQGISGNNTENEKNMLQKNMPPKFHSHPAHKARLNSVLLGGVEVIICLTPLLKSRSRNWGAPERTKEKCRWDHQNDYYIPALRLRRVPGCVYSAS